MEIIEERPIKIVRISYHLPPIRVMEGVQWFSEENIMPKIVKFITACLLCIGVIIGIVLLIQPYWMGTYWSSILIVDVAKAV